LLEKPEGASQKALDQDGYDDGGVADLTLVVDLEDAVQRRKRGETAYFTALRADLLPRITTGNTMSSLGRRDQKIRLAKLLFSDEEDETETSSEVYVEQRNVSDPPPARRLERLNTAKQALRWSAILREPACCSLSLSELSKRYLLCYGKKGGEHALRCAEKAMMIASDGFYDSDVLLMEVNEKCVCVFSSVILTRHTYL